MSADPAAGLLERAGELRALESAVRRAAVGEGRVMVIEGPAGIGKTALVRASRAIAREAGLTVLGARGTELEHAFGFGVVRQLLEPAVHALDGAAPAAFTGPARLAAPLLDVELPGAPTPPAPGAEATLAALHGLSRLVANLARDAPLALVVDDAHWADPPSRRFLACLATRVEALAVLLVVAGRAAGEPGAAGPPLAVEAGSAQVLRPRPLSARGAARLLRAERPDASEELCRACHEATGGNPFYLRELVAAIVAADVRAAADVGGLLPEGVAAAVGARLRRLPEPARRLAHAVATLGDGALLRHAAAVAGLDDDVASSAADTLDAAGILHGGRPPAFPHPLLRAAVDAELTYAERAALHARAADLLAAEDAPAERLAAHILLAEPSGSPTAVARLERAAGEALRRAAPDAAVAYLRRALLEPPPVAERPAILVELGHAEVMAQEIDAGIAHLRQATESLEDPSRRLEAAMELGGLLALRGEPGEAIALLERVLERSGAVDPALTGEVEAQLVNVAKIRLDARPRVERWAQRVRRRVLAGEPVSRAELVAAASDMVLAGEPAAPIVALCERALARGPLLPPRPGDFTTINAIRSLIVADRLDTAERAVDGLVDEARRSGARFYESAPLVWRADVHWRRGALARAVADARASTAVFAGWESGLPAAVGVLVNALVDAGDFDGADGALADAGCAEPAGALPAHYMVSMLLHARGRLLLARGRAQAGVEELLEAGRRQQAQGDVNPSMLDWRSGAALGLARLGEHEQARRLAAEELELARGFGAPRAIGMARRAVGVVQEDLAALREAVAVLAPSPARLEHARALADLGVALRRRDRDAEAREALSAALQLAHDCGARPLQALALRELRATGARPRRAHIRGPAALTPAERRVAEMAAAGRSNRQIADELVVAVRTVEFHLSGAFRKLGIASRRDLRDAL